MATVQQGHLYQHGSHRVLVMATRPYVTVREVLGDQPPWMGPAFQVKPEWLKPLPMKYFKGQVPRG